MVGLDDLRGLFQPMIPPFYNSMKGWTCQDLQGLPVACDMRSAFAIMTLRKPVQQLLCDSLVRDEKERVSEETIFPTAPTSNQPFQIPNCLKQESVNLSCFRSPGDLNLSAGEIICFPPGRMYHSHFPVQVFF